MCPPPQELRAERSQRGDCCRQRWDGRGACGRFLCDGVWRFWVQTPIYFSRHNPALTIIVSHHRKGGWCNRETWYSLSYSCMFVYAFACMLYPHLCMYAWRGAKGPLPGGSFGGLWAGTSWRVRPLQDLAAAVLQASEDVLDTSLGGIEPLCAIGRAFVGLDL